mmetsp:Transcript_90230/g.289396  ORF Transcript_90230/g.289396 Transcript_90230/m.289396 type:complete len:181 (+) Transcript_90230:600-1142(+)
MPQSRCRAAAHVCRMDHCSGCRKLLARCQGTGTMLTAPPPEVDKTTITVRRLDDFPSLQGPAIIELWHIDVEGAEMMLLRSAKRLFAEKRIRRVMMEWRERTPSDFPIAAEIFAGWTCVTACTGTLYHWEGELGGTCNPMWQSLRDARETGWGKLQAVDVYCVAPGVSNDLGLAVLSIPA